MASLSGGDKFKNFLSGIGSKVGLTTHKISTADFIPNPPKGAKDDWVPDPKNKRHWKFDWATAR